MKNACRLIPLVALIALLSSCQDHDLANNIVSQNGLPLSLGQAGYPNLTSARGSMDVSYDKSSKKLRYSIPFENIKFITASFRIGPRGGGGSIVYSIVPTALVDFQKTGSTTGSFDIPAQHEQDLLNGLFFLDLNTELHAVPKVALRGQIEFYNLSFNVSKKDIPLSGDQEVPAKSVPGTGIGEVLYNKNTKLLSYSVMYNNLSGNPTMGHIHGSAPRGVNAPVLFPFSFFSLPAPTSGPVNGSVTLTAAQEADLLNGLYYFNLHTAANPGGEIRGQIEF